MGNAVDKGSGFLFHLNRHVADSETDKHKHDYAELLYVSDGSLTQHVCGEDVDMRTGDVCLLILDVCIMKVLKKIHLL